MNRFSKYSLTLLAAFCMLTCCLSADSIPTLMATSASVTPSGCTNSAGCFSDISVIGESFTLHGTGSGGYGLPGGLQFLIPFSTSFSVSGTIPNHFVTGQFEGTFVNYYGSVTVNGPDIVLTCPSPETTRGCLDSPTVIVTVIGQPLATLTGSFSACNNSVMPFCFPPPAVGNVSIDLPGYLSVGVEVIEPGIGRITESFTSTSTPEPASLIPVALGIALTIGLILRRKYLLGQMP